MNTIDPWLAGAEAANEDVPAWFADLRRAGCDAFAARGLPTTRDEDWKYTNLAPLTRIAFESKLHANGSSAIPGNTISLGGRRLVFVNGRYAAEQSVTDGTASEALVMSLRDGLAQVPDLVRAHLGSRIALNEQPLAALNTAHLEQGAVVYVPRNVALDAPVELVFFAAANRPVVAHPRILVVLEAGASATVVERYIGDDSQPYLTNVVTEAIVGPNASLRHVKTQEEGAAAFHLASIWAHQAPSSRFRSCSISLGAALARTDISTLLDGEGAECDLDGLYIGRNQQHVDHHTIIDHRSPHASSRELYKGVLDDAATGVFNGKVFVRQDAQKSNAQQMNKNLLLSDSATVDTKPQLEIFADDVKCSHGATVGRLDATALFYLRSRGIDAQRAREILVYAFANEMLDRIAIEPLRIDLERTLGARFAEASVRAAA